VASFPGSSTPSTNTGPDYGTDPFSNDPTRADLATAAEMGRSNFRTSVIQLDRPGDPSVFDEKTQAEAAALVARYPEGNARSALGPMLHLCQSVQGQVTPDGIAFCAKRLNLTKAQVAAFATFYTMYKRVPTGEYLVSVCTNTLCGMLGGDEIFAALKDELGVGNNETSSDGKVTLEHAECLAACDYAPVVTVNYEFFDNQTVGTARNLVSQLRNGVPTEVGVKLAIERGDTAPSYAAGDEGRARPKTTGRKQPTSAHDAPLSTAESDKATSAEPGDSAPTAGEKGQ
jgi:NADH-quinone oxidoreductase subunit E